MKLTEVEVQPRPLERYAELLDPQLVQSATAAFAHARERLVGRVVWNVNTTAIGGGVAELLRPLLGYLRGFGVDSRWMVIAASTDFFRVTKRLHNALHGSVGDGSPLGPPEQALYEAVLHDQATQLGAVVRAHDLVILHDPQTAGLIPALARRGALVVWRYHIGHDEWNAEVERGWRFLAPYLEAASAYVFSRATYIPPSIDRTRCTVIPPSIDPFAAKNQQLSESSVRAILHCTGLIESPQGCDLPIFVRDDGTPGRVDRAAEILRMGPAPAMDVPLVVQVSRWDRLKDPVGVVAGFAHLVDRDPESRAELVLAGPNVQAVADDPEGAEVFAETAAVWRALPDEQQRRIHLVSLPTVDRDENAAIVNALQRHAAVVVQKSLHEGFGLTVTEALWKARPVLASAVGGIRDQIQSGENGVLLDPPTDLDRFAELLHGLLADPEAASRLGERGHLRVLHHYLGIHTLLRYAALLDWLDGGAREELPTAA